MTSLDPRPWITHRQGHNSTRRRYRTEGAVFDPRGQYENNPWLYPTYMTNGPETMIDISPQKVAELAAARLASALRGTLSPSQAGAIQAALSALDTLEQALTQAEERLINANRGPDLMGETLTMTTLDKDYAGFVNGAQTLSVAIARDVWLSKAKRATQLDVEVNWSNA